MCLAVPMQVIEMDGVTARCNANGVERTVNLFLLDAPLAAGEFVLVHVGYAIQKISAQHARSAWELHDQMQAHTPHA